jgi:hypothetical protein
MMSGAYLARLDAESIETILEDYSQDSAHKTLKSSKSAPAVIRSRKNKQRQKSNPFKASQSIPVGRYSRKQRGRYSRKQRNPEAALAAELAKVFGTAKTVLSGMDTDVGLMLQPTQKDPLKLVLPKRGPETAKKGPGDSTAQ